MQTVSPGLQGDFATTLSAQPRDSVQTRNLAGFTLRTSLARFDHLVMRGENITISSSGMASRSVTAVDIVMLATGPAIAHVDDGTLFYQRASTYISPARTQRLH